jgi:hypothetical protein
MPPNTKSTQFRAPRVFHPTTDGSAHTKTINVVFVRYVAGFADAASVPAPLKHGMMLVIGDMYENRTDSVKRLPTASEYLWNPYRVFEILNEPGDFDQRITIQNVTESVDTFGQRVQAFSHIGERVGEG